MGNVNKLPDCYAKGKHSNNHKLLDLNEQAISDVKADALAVLNMLDLDQATGKTLDLYGDMVGQRRGDLDDTQYRNMIYTKIGINVCQGTVKTVRNVIQQVFNCEPSELIIGDGWESGNVVISFPYEKIVNAGFTAEQTITSIESLLPVGVSIEYGSFEGSFEFADTADEYDENAGFGDIEQTIGGVFGLEYERPAYEPPSEEM